MDLRTLPIEEFVAEIKVGGSYTDHRYTLFLGAGCSKSSGIPTAGELVRDYWIPKMAPSGEDPIEWAKNHIDGFDQDNPEASYGAVIEKRFRIPRVRQAEIERICEVASPEVGYSVVAQLCTQVNTPFSVVLTTNFDDLVANAMIIYTNVHPIVISDESLANQIHSTRSGPMVIKLHGDARLSPKNTTQETEEIDKAVRDQAKKLLDGRGLLFFGYAGADNSVFNMLDELPPNALNLGVYWVNENLPSSEKFQKWLEEREAAWVRHTDFDKAMRHFRREYDLHPLEKDRIDKVFNENKLWSQQTLADRGRIDTRLIADEGKPQLMAEAEAVGSSADAWRLVDTILAMENQDTDAILSAYQEAVRKYPGFTPLLNNYALFLTDVRGDHDAAENCYKRAIEAEPNQADLLGNYALFLTTVRHNHDAAKTFYQRAIEADHNHAGILNKYALFLNVVCGDHAAAESMFKRAIEADPKDAGALNNYAFLLMSVRGDYNAAESMFKRAVEADTERVAIGYRRWLSKGTIEADPARAGVLGNYAQFLTTVRADHDAAETYYKRAIDADPNHAAILGNYARFLKNIRGDHDAAESMFKRAIEVDPNQAGSLDNNG